MNNTFKVLIFIGILSIGSCGAYAKSCDAKYGGIIDKYSEYTLCREYSVGYDADLKTPRWVAYIITKQSMIKLVKRKGSFRSDRKLSKKDRTYSSWYIRSGYDRGHMAPAINFRYNKIAEAHSFIMSNVVPQLPGVNRGIWRSLEYRTQKSVRLLSDAIVITGPIFNGPVKLIRNKLRVPSAFYKIIIRSYPRQSIAFIIPNVKPPHGYKLKNYLTTIDNIESIVNIDFISDYSVVAQNKLESNKAIKVDWPIILK